MKDNINKTEHYKMYKAGKHWFFAGITAFALVGAVQAAQPDLGNSMHASAANILQDNTQAAGSYFKSNDALTAWINQQFTDPTTGQIDVGAGVIGKYVTLPKDVGVAQDSKINMDYWVQDAFIQLVHGQGRITFVAGTTTFFITVHGNTSTNVDVSFQAQIGNGSTNEMKLFSSVQPEQTVSYTPTDANVGDGGDNVTLNMRYHDHGNDNWYGYYPIHVAFQTAAQHQQTLAQANADNTTLANKRSDVASKNATAQTTANQQIDADKTLTAAQKAAKKQAIQNAIDAENNAAKTTYYVSDWNANMPALQNAVDSATAAAKTPGTPIPDQQKQAVKDLTTTANQALQNIANDNGLTTAQKQAQTKAVNDALAAATNTINNADNADDIQGQDTPDANAKIAALYQKSTATPAQQKTDAVNAAPGLATAAKSAIDAEPTLTDAEKAARKTAIDTAVTNLQNAQATPDDVAAKQQALNDAIAAGEKPGDTVDNQKAAAIAKFKSDNNVQSTLDAIANDPTLTDAQKQTQTKAVNDTVAKVSNDVNAATTAQGIQDAVKNDASQVANIQHTAGTPVSQQAAQADSQVDQYAEITKKTIDADNILTSDEKTAQKAKVDAQAATIKQSYANGTAQTIAAAMQTAQGQLNGQYTAGKPLPDRQKDAETAIDQAATQAKSDIDPTLPDAEKTAQSNAIDAAAQAAKSKVDSATTADDVNSDVSAAQTNLSGLSDAKKTDRQTLNTQAANAVNTVNADNSLTSQQKTDRINAVNAARDAALLNVDKATSATDANTATNDTGLTNAITASQSHDGIASVTDQQKNAEAKVDNAGTDAKTAIDNAKTAAENAIAQDGSLTPEQKAAQKTAIDLAVAQQKASISNANDADAIAKAQAAAVQAIQQLQADKADAHTALAKQAQAAIDQINASPVLSSAEKASRVQNVTNAYNAAINNVDQATTSADVATAKSAPALNSAITTNTDTSSVPTVAKQQDAANDAVDSAATAANNKIDDQASVAEGTIDSNGALTPAQKQAQKAAIQAAVTQAKKNIKNAQTADDITKAQNAAETTLSGLTDAKVAAHKSLAGLANDAISKINNDSNLTTTQKGERVAAVTQAYNNDIAGVDNATDTATVNNAAGGSDALKNAINTNTSDDGVQTVAQQAETAKSTVQKALSDAQAKVDADSTLTADQKAAQKAALKTAADNLNAKIANDKTADDVQTDADNAPATLQALTDAKSTAHTNLDSAVSAAKAKIDNNANLSQAEKNKRNQAIDAAAQTASNNIDSATTPADANSASSSNDLTNALNAQTDFSNVPSLDEQRNSASTDVDGAAQTAKNNLDQAATAAKDAIDTNGNLTADQKAVEKAAIDQAVQTAKDNIKNAQSADQIASLKQAIIDNVNTINAEKQQAHATLAKQAQDAVDKVNADPVLTADQKASRVQAIKDALANAGDGVDKATDATSINNAVANNGLAAAITTAQSHDGVQSIADQQAAAQGSADQAGQTAENNLDKAATAAENAIATDGSLTPEQKAAQKQAIQTAVANAKASIGNAQSADGIASAKQSALDAINGLNDAKATARKALAQEAQNAIDKVNANPDLSSADKATRVQAITAAYQAAGNKVDQATTIADVQNAAKSTDLDNATAANTDFSKVTPVAQQAQDAVTALKQTLADAQAKVDANNVLTADEKSAQKQVLANIEAAQEPIHTSSKSADDLATNVKNAKNAINALANAQTVAATTVASQAKSATEAVNNNKALTSQEKTDRINALNTAVKTALGTIAEASDVNTVNGVTAAGSTFDQAQKAATSDADVVPVETQKANADSAIDKATTEAKAKVDTDSTLSEADKQAQKAVIDDQANAAKKQVTDASTADDINKAISDNQKAMDNLDKTTADEFLDSAVKKQHALINDNVNMTQAQKDAANKAIDDVRATYQDYINKAPNKIEALGDATTGADRTLAEQERGANVPDIDSQKNTAKAAIDDAEAAADKAIDNDGSLSQADKDAQKATIKEQADNARTNIANAKNADDVNTYRDNGKSTVAGMDKTAADKTLADSVKSQHEAVNNNKALSQAQKDQANQAIDAAAKTAQDTINKATSADDANKDAQAGVTNSTQAGTAVTSAVPSIDTQKATAKADVDAAEKAADDKIDADGSLSQADKDAQKATVKAQADAARTKIANDTDADSLNNDVKAVQDTLAGMDKTAADKTLADSVKSQHDSVNNNKALSQAQKDQANQAIDVAAKTAQDNINKATSADDANKDAQTGVTSSTQAGTSVTSVVPSIDAQKASAKADVDAAEKAADDKIDADSSLSQADKDAQKATVKAQADAARDKIAQDTDADSLNKDVKAVQDTLAGMDKTAADKTLASTVAAEHATINSNKALSQDQKDAANNAIDAAARAAQNTINKATSADEANQAAQAGVDKASEAAMSATDNVPTVDTQKADAEKSIDDNEAAAEKAVDADANLSDTDKTAQKSVLKQMAATAKAAVAKEDNADAIAKTTADNKQAMIDLNNAKSAADKALADQINQAEADINKNVNLSGSEKADRIAQLEDAKKNAQGLINAAETPANVTAATAKGSNFDRAQGSATDVSAVKTVAQQRADATSAADTAGSTAKNNLDKAATAAEGAIDQNGNLTPEQKAAQKAAIDKAVADAKANIGNQPNSDDITKAKQAALDLVNGLSQVKQDARKELAAEAQKAIDQINSDKALNAQQKADRVAAVTAAYNKAGDAVDQATDNDGVAAAENSSDFANALKAQTDVSALPTVDQQHDTAKNAIAQALAAAKAQVNADKNLSQADKDAQNAVLQNQADTYNKAIAGADNADDINKDAAVGGQALGDLANAKKAADQQLADQITAAEKAVNDNKALSSAEKTKRVSDLESARQAAQSAINQATTPTSVSNVLAPDSIYSKATANAQDTTGVETVD
ncbi:DUF1542 domain-containing protein [Fructobacillus ficulneus]|uniref:DUF1542 domain-containing protein n=1 Tax=Fructobacillus ficulneus TaxID=157463 RepID=A0A0K8MIL8_9LACO|nr:DUF1542 domain-containing protein [Fructobacillus ficulneus]GAP00303.1 hypothetical protein FFIC_283170 [Fructobacillus ficulneus]